MTWYWVVTTVAVLWLPAGALLNRGAILVERLDPPRQEAPRAVVIDAGETYSEMHIAVIDDNDHDFWMTVIFWPIVIAVLSVRYALRGVRAVIFATHKLKGQLPSRWAPGNALRALAGVKPRRDELE